MRKQQLCPLTCPMLNQFGFCESAMRREERMTVCPHKKMQKAVTVSSRGSSFAPLGQFTLSNLDA